MNYMLHPPGKSEEPDFASPAAIFCGGTTWISSLGIFWVFLPCRAEHTAPASAWGTPCSKAVWLFKDLCCSAWYFNFNFFFKSSQALDFYFWNLTGSTGQWVEPQIPHAGVSLSGHVWGAEPCRLEKTNSQMSPFPTATTALTYRQMKTWWRIYDSTSPTPPPRPQFITNNTTGLHRGKDPRQSQCCP